MEIDFLAEVALFTLFLLLIIIIVPILMGAGLALFLGFTGLVYYSTVFGMAGFLWVLILFIWFLV